MKKGAATGEGGWVGSTVDVGSKQQRCSVKSRASVKRDRMYNLRSRSSFEDMNAFYSALFVGPNMLLSSMVRPTVVIFWFKLLDFKFRVSTFLVRTVKST
jgi:hypothetical protein